MSLSVERSHLEYQASAASLVTIDPLVMERHSLAADQLVRLATFWGQNIWARLAAPAESDRGSGLVRLNRFQRQSLKAHLHQPIELYPEAEQPVQKVVLQPSVDLFTARAHHLEQHLKDELVQLRAPVSANQLLFAHFHHSVAGLLYRVQKVEPGPGVVSESTDVVLDPAPEGFGDDLSLDTTFEDLGGLDAEIRLVKELVQIPLQFPGVYRQLGIRPMRGVLFYGPPGTGKTHLARAIASEFHAQFFYINGPEIIGSMYGETEGNLRKMFSEATHHAPSIIFIDELDVMAPKRGETGSHSDTRMVTQLLSLMDGLAKVEGVVVIGTTNRVDALDRALRRPGRFDRELYLGPPSRAGRLQVLQIHSREMPLAEETQQYLPELARGTHGFVGADLMELCREAGLNALRRHLQQGQEDGQTERLHQLDLEHLRVEPEDFQRAKASIRPSATREALVEFPTVRFADVGGLEEAKEELRATVVERLRGAAPTVAGKEGLLLVGPTGSGKSLLVQAAAGESEVSLITVSGPELFTKWLGESEEAVRHVFLVARQLAPCILFFDQLDALAPVRGPESGSRTTERVVSQLLSELDALDAAANVVVVAATNRPELVDPSMLRPGRFGLRVRVPLPTVQERRDILALQLRAAGLLDRMRPAWVEQMARETDGLSGAELNAFVQRLQGRLAGAARGTEQPLEAIIAQVLQSVRAGAGLDASATLFQELAAAGRERY